MWKRISAYSLFALGLLTTTYFRKYSGELIPYPFLFWLLGIAMFWGGFWLLRYAPSTKEISAQKQLAIVVRDLKQNGEKIQINLMQCELKEHSYFEKKNKYGHESEFLTLDVERQIEGWNVLTGDQMRNVEQVHIKQTVIVFTQLNTRSGETEKFTSRVVPKDKVTLSFYLDEQKQTTLYVDKTNRQRYYFDLDFLSA